MLYYIYNTTTRLTFIPLLLMVKGMYNPGRKWVWNSHIYTVSWSDLVVCSTTYIIHIPITMRRRGINVSLVVVLYM
jgi:hypothetical protein